MEQDKKGMGLITRYLTLWEMGGDAADQVRLVLRLRAERGMQAGRISPLGEAWWGHAASVSGGEAFAPFLE